MYFLDFRVLYLNGYINMKPTKYNFEKMQKADIKLIMAIEKKCYEIGWSKGVMLDCIQSDYDCIVLKCDENIIGYGILMTGFEESHLLNMCIDPTHQGNGLGNKLLKYMESISVYKQSKTFLLEVRLSSLVAQSLYKSFGFKQIGLRKNYYKSIDGKEDAIIMSKKFKTSS